MFVYFPFEPFLLLDRTFDSYYFLLEIMVWYCKYSIYFYLHKTCMPFCLFISMVLCNVEWLDTCKSKLFICVSVSSGRAAAEPDRLPGLGTWLIGTAAGGPSLLPGLQRGSSGWTSDLWLTNGSGLAQKQGWHSLRNTRRATLVQVGLEYKAYKINLLEIRPVHVCSSMIAYYVFYMAKNKVLKEITVQVGGVT